MTPGPLVQIARTLPWPHAGGMETHAWELARAWQRAGREVEILTTSFDDRDRVETREGIRIHYLRHLPVNRDEVPRWHWWHRFGARARDYALAHRIDADLVHSESAYGHKLFAALARRGHDATRLMTLHGTTLLTYRETGRPNLLARHSAWHPRAVAQAAYVAWRVRRERRREFPTAHRLITVSPELAQHLTRDYACDARSVETIANGIHPPSRHEDREALRTRLGLARDARILLYLGRLEPSKGLPRILEHLARAPRDRFLVAGSGPDTERLKTLALRLPNPAAVRFLGPVSDAEKNALLQAADVFVLPSDSEGQPITILEALAAGTPVYARRPWAPADVAELLAHGDDVSHGIDAAYAKADRVRAAADRIAKQYSWDEVARRYEAAAARAKA